MPDVSDRFLRLSAVLHKTGLSRSTLYRKVRLGAFPRQVAISTRCAAWWESDVDAWMRDPMLYRVEEQPRRAQ